LRARASEPLLTTVLCTAALPVLSLLGKVQALRLPLSNPSLKYVVAITPVPVSATTWGLSAALSVKVRLALRVPLAPGVKVRLIVHELPAARVLEPPGQVLLWAKSAAFVPVSAMLLMLKESELLLVRVTVLVALVIPTIWLPKLTLVGFKYAPADGAIVPL